MLGCLPASLSQTPIYVCACLCVSLSLNRAYLSLFSYAHSSTPPSFLLLAFLPTFFLFVYVSSSPTLRRFYFLMSFFTPFSFLFSASVSSVLPLVFHLCFPFPPFVCLMFSRPFFPPSFPPSFLQSIRQLNIPLFPATSVCAVDSTDQSNSRPKTF